MKLFIAVCLWVLIVAPALQYCGVTTLPRHYYHAVVKGLGWSAEGLVFVGASGLLYDFVGWCL